MPTKSVTVTTSLYEAHSCWEELNGNDNLHRPPITRILSVKDSIRRDASGIIIVYINVRNAALKIMEQGIVRRCRIRKLM